MQKIACCSIINLGKVLIYKAFGPNKDRMESDRSDGTID